MAEVTSLVLQSTDSTLEVVFAQRYQRAWAGWVRVVS